MMLGCNIYLTLGYKHGVCLQKEAVNVHRAGSCLSTALCSGADGDDRKLKVKTIMTLAAALSRFFLCVNMTSVRVVGDGL